MKKPGIIELHEKLNNKEITSEELIREAINNAHELQEKCNAFVTIMDDANSDFYKNNVYFKHNKKSILGQKMDFINVFDFSFDISFLLHQRNTHQEDVIFLSVA